MTYLIGIIILSTFLWSYFTKNRTEEGCEKVVSRKSFGYKLIAWTLKSEPQFRGYCPFFWSFWLCLFLIPFTLVCKGLEFIGSLWRDFREEKGEEAVKILSMETIHIFATTHDDPDRCFATYYPEWYAANLNWRVKYEKWIAAQNRRQERAAKRSEFMQSQLAIAGKYAKWLVKPVIISSAFLVVWGLMKLLIGIGSVVSGGELVKTVLIIAAALAAFSFCKYLFRWVKTAARITKKVVEKAEVSLDFDDGPGIMSKVWDIVCFPFRLAARAYKKECPLIVYKD